ncbi:hypothetical protein EYZ11_005168 [Aspergillus tanneri]|nr:hypothetical protein EYZ11_005168 [Aspergillus tanneri]
MKRGDVPSTYLCFFETSTSVGEVVLPCVYIGPFVNEALYQPVTGLGDHPTENGVERLRRASITTIIALDNTGGTEWLWRGLTTIIVLKDNAILLSRSTTVKEQLHQSLAASNAVANPVVAFMLMPISVVTRVRKGSHSGQ